MAVAETASGIATPAFSHPWLDGPLLDGTAPPEQIRAFAVAMIGLYDHLPRLYGPPYMTGADYKVRRIIADQLLSTIPMPNGPPARIGEGAHAALARDLAEALGVDPSTAAAAEADANLAACADELVATLFEPPHWVAMGAVAEAESGIAPTLGRIQRALMENVGLNAGQAVLFDAPPIFRPDRIEYARAQIESPFDQAQLDYYVTRVRDELRACWYTCFAAAAAA